VDPGGATSGLFTNPEDLMAYNKLWAILRSNSDQPTRQVELRKLKEEYPNVQRILSQMKVKQDNSNKMAAAAAAAAGVGGPGGPGEPGGPGGPGGGGLRQQLAAGPMMAQRMMPMSPNNNMQQQMLQQNQQQQVRLSPI
jgi:hypothetical protein